MPNYPDSIQDLEPLSGLYIRKRFLNEVRTFLDQKHPQGWCIVAIDIENFKLFNDWYGQDSGDYLLLEIATVLAKSHKLCIFDEPEAGIDLWSFSMLIEQFEKIHKEKKESLVLISHQERIIQMADRIMVIEDGKIASIGATDEILPQLLGKTADSYSCLTCR